MADLLLAHTWHQALDPAENALGKPYPPLGPLVSLAELTAAGHDVAFYDATFSADVDLFGAALDGHRPKKVAILADPHAVPQKMCLTAVREAALRMVALAKARGAQVLVAGPDVSDRPQLYASADVVVLGEHDDVLQEWAAGADFHGIQPRRPVRARLDELPFPAWDQVDLRAYADRWRRRHGYWELNVSTGRGCPYRCAWCAKPTWGRTYHVRSPERVVVELAEVRRRGADRVAFTDDIFAVKPAWLREFRGLVERDPLPFRCLTRADLVRDAGYVADLRASGCVEVWLGAESGSDSVLAAMDKDQTRDDLDRASELLKQAGIRRGFFLQLGYPGESRRDVDATVDMIRRLRPEEIGVSVSYPLPGTPFFDRVKADLRDTNWAHAMDNTVLFSGAYPQPFYDAVRELLRTEQALRTWTPRAGLRRTVALPRHALRWPIERARMAWFSRGSGTTPRGGGSSPAGTPAR